MRAGRKITSRIYLHIYKCVYKGGKEEREREKLRPFRVNRASILYRVSDRDTPTLITRVNIIIFEKNFFFFQFSFSTRGEHMRGTNLVFKFIA